MKLSRYYRITSMIVSLYSLCANARLNAMENKAFQSSEKRNELQTSDTCSIDTISSYDGIKEFSREYCLVFNEDYDLNYSKFKSEFDDTNKDEDSVNFYKCICGQKAVCFVLVRTFEEDKKIYIRRFFTVSGFQGKGYGTTFFPQFLEKMSKQNPGYMIYLICAPMKGSERAARRLYGSCMKKTDTDDCTFYILRT